MIDPVMSQPEPYITVRAVQPVVAALDVLGHDTEKLLDSANLDAHILNDPEGRVPHSTMMALWKNAVVATGDINLGIHLAQAAPIRSFEVHAYAVLSSPTLRDAYRRAVRYQRLIHEATDLKFEEGTELGVLSHALPGGRAVPRQPAEFLVSLWMRFGRLVAGEDWVPNAVYLAHDAPGDCSEHERLFRAPIVFMSGKTALYVPNQILDTPNRQSDVGLLDVLDRYAAERLREAPSRFVLAERVRARLMGVLTDGVPTAEGMADALHMSPRTLHRALGKEGTTYLEILNTVRHERAAALLTKSRHSIAEVAFLLGFDEISSFYRAFKRWTGKAPAEYQKVFGMKRPNV